MRSKVLFKIYSLTMCNLSTNYQVKITKCVIWKTRIDNVMYWNWRNYTDSLMNGPFIGRQVLKPWFHLQANFVCGTFLSRLVDCSSHTLCYWFSSSRQVGLLDRMSQHATVQHSRPIRTSLVKSHDQDRHP